MSLRLRLACRPIIGMFVTGKAIHIPIPTTHVIRHNRLGTYLIRPWPDTPDPRRDWGQLKRAYRFHSHTYAQQYVTDEKVPATVVDIPLASF